MIEAFSLSWKNISATPAPFKLKAGFYQLSVRAETWSGGSVRLVRLSADGSVFATALKVFSADDSATAFVVSGVYQLKIASATDVSANLVLKEPS